MALVPILGAQIRIKRGYYKQLEESSLLPQALIHMIESRLDRITLLPRIRFTLRTNINSM